MFTEISRPLMKDEAEHFRRKAKRIYKDRWFIKFVSLLCTIGVPAVLIYVFFHDGELWMLLGAIVSSIYAACKIALTLYEIWFFRNFGSRGYAIELHFLSSRSFCVFEDHYDMGENYFFDLDGQETFVINTDKLTFDDFPVNWDKFPSDDFKLIRFFDDDNSLQEQVLACRGKFLEPIKRFTTRGGQKIGDCCLIQSPFDLVLADVSLNHPEVNGGINP